MTRWSDPAAQRWLVGAEIRHYRKSAGLSAVAVAKAIGCTPGKVHHLESGRNHQQPDDVRELLTYVGAPEGAITRLTDLAAHSTDRAWWSPWAEVVTAWFRLFAGLEALAHEEFLYEPVLIPGLLQTEAYARSVTAATPRVRPDHAEKFVEFRRARSALLFEDEPLKLCAVIGEAALRLNVGDPSVLNEQRHHLLHLMQRNNVDLRVLCPEDGIHSGFTGAFGILDFEHAHSVSYVEMQDDAAYIHDQERIRGYRMASKNLAEVARSPQESAQLIASMLDD